MTARVVAIVFLVGVIALASTFQQVIDLQPDEIASVCLDDFDRPQGVSSVTPHRQPVAIEWPAAQPNMRTHTLTVFRPPRLAAR